MPCLYIGETNRETNLKNKKKVQITGMSLANVIPHYVKGVTGEPFPTPFANPPGKGLSSPMTNVIWALANLALGVLMIKFSHLSFGNALSLIPFFIGFVLITMVSVINFTNKP